MVKHSVRIPIQVQVRGGWVEETLMLSVLAEVAPPNESPEGLASRVALALSSRLRDPDLVETKP
jgi:hypothetical protein